MALGPELPALFCNDEAMAAGLLAASAETRDPVLALAAMAARRRPGRQDPDLNNVASGGFAGAITAALFMERFVANGVPWAHFDVYAWNPKPRPGRPEGAKPFGLHACFSYVSRWLAGQPSAYSTYKNSNWRQSKRFKILASA